MHLFLSQTLISCTCACFQHHVMTAHVKMREIALCKVPATPVTAPLGSVVTFVKQVSFFGLLNLWDWLPKALIPNPYQLCIRKLCSMCFWIQLHVMTAHVKMREIALYKVSATPVTAPSDSVETFVRQVCFCNMGIIQDNAFGLWSL